MNDSFQGFEFIRTYIEKLLIFPEEIGNIMYKYGT